MTSAYWRNSLLQKLNDPNRNFLHVGLFKEVTARGVTRDLLKDMYPNDFASIRLSSRIATPRGTVAVGDVVFLRLDGERRCGEVMLHYSRNNEVLSVVSLWEPAPSLGTVGHTRRYRVVNNPQIILSANIEEPLIYSHTDDFATVLLTPLYR